MILAKSQFHLRPKKLKRIVPFLLMFMILFPCMMCCLGLAAESTENPENLNNTSNSISEIETATINPSFLESWCPSPTEPDTFTNNNGSVLGTGYMPSPVDLSGLGRSNKRLLVRASENLPTVYDLRKEGKTTVAKDQGTSGCCWAFGSLSSLESYLLGTEGVTYDFSENNMKNLLSENYSEGFDLAPDEGGNAFMATAYLARWTGPVTESDDPYSDVSVYSPIELPIQKHVQEVLILPERTRSLDNEYIKKALMKYGAVFTTMYWDKNYYTENVYSYRYTGDEIANHALTIVGWDDSFDRNKFNQVPPGNGAFIVKNNWGQAWGEGGYFYVSYYDSKIGYDENAVFTAQSTDNYDYNYQYDPLGWVVSKEYANSLIAWGGNVFSSKGNETLRAVGFYTTDLNTIYDIYVYENPAAGPLNSGRVFTAHESGTYSFPGYHTYALNSPVALKQGEKFSVVIKLSNPTAGGILAVEQPINPYSSKAKANPGESYTSQNGINWEDISRSIDSDVCIKAFTTTDSLPKANFTSDITDGTYPLTVRFTDLSKDAFSWEWDLNGDGITDSTLKNPTYTYSSYGNYTVSLKVGNRNGFDSKTNSNYVTVIPLSITSAIPEGRVISVQGDVQRFSIKTNHVCNVSWYLNGELKIHELNVNNSSYYSGSLSPGLYTVSCLAEARDEKAGYSWDWTVHEWNPWESSTLKDGKNVTTSELQEAIHYYQNGLQIPKSGLKVTSDLLKELIEVWRGVS
jgi:C1A family cysteine protease/PKD repeat protein